jgi:uncharacterized protein
MDSARGSSAHRRDTAIPKPLQPTVRLLIVQPTPFCNINCSYCYLSSRSSRAMIEDHTLEHLFAKLFSSGWVRQRLDLAWHAGEPTVLPIAFYQRAFAIVERYRPRNLDVCHSFQTNATLLTKAWCDFFRDAGIRVGVSVDGPKHINDLSRVSRAGQSTFPRVLAGIRLLRAESVPFHVITVLTGESLRSARALHDFYAAEGIEHVGFNVDESEGEHVSALEPGPDSWRAYTDFLAEFWSIAAREGQVKSIREIDYMVRAVYQQPIRPINAAPARGNMLVEPFAVLNVDHSGNIATFSPELLGQANADYNDYIIGNVNTDAFADLPHNGVLAKMSADIEAGVEMCRARCGYFHVCGGGEPVNKMAENGTFASDVTSYCRMTRMGVADLVTTGPHAG